MLANLKLGLKQFFCHHDWNPWRVIYKDKPNEESRVCKMCFKRQYKFKK